MAGGLGTAGNTGVNAAAVRAPATGVSILTGADSAEKMFLPVPA